MLQKNHFNLRTISALALLTILTLFLQFSIADAGMKSPPPKKAKVVIIGDRIVDIAYNLGVLPEAMSVRGSLWPMAKKLKTVSQILGCPKCVTKKRKNAVPDALSRFNIKRVIISKNNNPYCLYKPEIKPVNVLPLLKDQDVDIQYVDFSKGLKSAIYQTAKLLNVESKADSLIQSYRKDLQKTKQMIPDNLKSKEIIIINGTYQPATGKSLLRVEAPGGYADKYLLNQLGCSNVGNVFKLGDMPPAKGHYMVRKNRNGFDLSPLVKANPEIIIATGDTFAVQKALENYSQTDPKFKKVKAVQNMCIYGLPGYIDSGIIEYPKVLRKWVVALTH